MLTPDSAGILASSFVRFCWTRGHVRWRAMTSSREMDTEQFIEDSVLNEICASHTRTRKRKRGAEREREREREIKRDNKLREAKDIFFCLQCSLPDIHFMGVNHPGSH